MITLIGIFIFVLSQFIYDYLGMSDSTNWSIWYFTTTYLSFLLIAFDLICKETSKAIQYTAASFGLYFVFLIILEISFINLPFDEYMTNVNDTSIVITAGIILSILLIYFTLMAWEKRRMKKSEK